MSRTGADVVRRLIRSGEEESRGSLTAGASLAWRLLAALAVRSSAVLEVAIFLPLASLSPTLAVLLDSTFFFSAAFLGAAFLAAVFLAGVFLATVFFCGDIFLEEVFLGKFFF